MSKNYILSVNQLADYKNATEKGRERIIAQQLKPSAVVVPRYQGAKGAVRRFFKSKGDNQILTGRLQELKAKKPETDWQSSDRQSSIDALEHFMEFSLPEFLRFDSFETLSFKGKNLMYDDVRLVIAPEIVFQVEVDGKLRLGAIKIHMTKNPFDQHQAAIVAELVRQYLIDKNIDETREIDPSLCYCVDVFGKRMMPAIADPRFIKNQIDDLCGDLKSRWNKAAA